MTTEQVRAFDAMTHRQNAAWEYVARLAQRLEDAGYTNDAVTVEWLHKRLKALERDCLKRDVTTCPPTSRGRGPEGDDDDDALALPCHRP